MSHGVPEMGQGEHTLTRAAGLVSDAKGDLDGLSSALEGQIQGLRGRWTGAGGSAFFALHQAWTDKQRVITRALDELGAALASTERDNMSTDETQSSGYATYAGRLG